jgi:hypothetical protein
MVINGKFANAHITISDKPNCLTISQSTPQENTVYSFDLEGRLWTAMLNGVSYRRGLNGRIVAKWIDAQRNHQRRWLNPDETSALQDNAQGFMKTLWAGIQSGQAKLDQELPASGQTTFLRAGQYDSTRYLDDVGKYQQVYKPVGILPPDQYMALVLQATEGCSFNTCTFCNFYRDRPFRIKTPDAFEQHIQQVREFLGAGLSLRRTIFLGDANALVIPMPRLESLLQIIHRQFDVEYLGGIYAFLDGFSGERKSVQDYRLLASQGVKRIYIGMESGNEELLRFLKKPGKAGDVLNAVHAIKDGGISVGVILLLGAGGQQFNRGHIQDTVQILNQMHLDSDDLIYFSELIESEGLDYTKDAYLADLSPLTSAERIHQGEEIERQLKFDLNGGTPHIARYDIREFVY